MLVKVESVCLKDCQSPEDKGRPTIYFPFQLKQVNSWSRPHRARSGWSLTVFHSDSCALLPPLPHTWCHQRVFPLQIPRMVKVVEESSPYFKIISPKDIGHKVAPGVPSIFRILFTPEENKVITLLGRKTEYVSLAPCRSTLDTRRAAGVHGSVGGISSGLCWGSCWWSW